MQMIEQEVFNVKKASNIAHLGFKRSRAGLLILNVRGIPDLEDYFRTLSDGETVEVALMGRAWLPVETGQVLRVYNLPPTAHAGVAGVTDSGAYRMDTVGTPILDLGSGEYGSRPCFNLSWLRLVGISEGSGVSFALKGVYSKEWMDQVKTFYRESLRHFFVNYLKPVDIVITMTSMEM